MYMHKMGRNKYLSILIILDKILKLKFWRQLKKNFKVELENQESVPLPHWNSNYICEEFYLFKKSMKTDFKTLSEFLPMNLLIFNGLKYRVINWHTLRSPKWIKVMESCLHFFSTNHDIHMNYILSKPYKWGLSKISCFML